MQVRLVWTSCLSKQKICFDDIKDNVKFTKPIAFNVIPHIDKFMDDGYTKEELKMRQETHKILSNEINFSATCVRVPVFIGHSEAVNIEFENKISVEEAREAIKNAPGCTLLDERADGGYVTPKECAGMTTRMYRESERIRLQKMDYLFG